MRQIPIIAAILVAAVLTPVAASADRMWIGFHDDPVLRYDGEKASDMEVATKTNKATILRTLVTWANIAPTKPANAANPNDPAYNFNDLDDFVRNAQSQDAEVLMTVWGTPKWANGNKTPNFLPTSMSSFQNFTKALASRYSGRTAGPALRPVLRDLERIEPRSVPVAAIQCERQDREPSGLREARSGGLRRDQGGQSQGARRDRRDVLERPQHPQGWLERLVRPGTFAEGVAKANKKLKFDAWAHHPYPVPVNGKPTQKVLWPNVTLTSLPRFETSIDKWFGRTNIPVWITEYGTRPSRVSRRA